MDRNETAKSRYEALKVRRQPFLNRAYRFAELTLPSMLPPPGFTSTLKLYQPYQGLGARAVTFLSSRLMTAVLPPGQKFFRFQIPPEVLAKAGKDTAGPDTEHGLTLVEDTVQGEVERRQWRGPTNLSLQHLIVTGNALEWMQPDNRIRVFRLDQYVVIRDPKGDVKEIIIEEHMAPASLDTELRQLVSEDELSNNTVPLYTWVQRRGNYFVAHQEMNTTVIPHSAGKYLVDKCPFNALRWSAVLGEDYGRSKCEEHWGDLETLEALSKSIVDGAALAARNIIAVKPNATSVGLNLRKRISSAKNGDVITLNPDDVKMLQFENVAGLQVTAAEIQRLTTDLKAAFLMTSSIQRQGDRVTATELKLMAEELDGTLGGVYSTLSSEMQLHRLNRLVVQMKAAGQLPDWPEGVIEPVILTGLEALGREQDVQKVATSLQFLQGLPPQVLDYVKWESLLGRAFNGLGLEDAVRTDAEVANIQQQRAIQEAMVKATQGAGETVTSAAQQAQQAT